MSSTTERIKQHDETLKRAVIWLRRHQFIVSVNPQEKWLDKELHEKIRYIHDDPNSDFLRYFPDLSAWHVTHGCFLIEIKSTQPEYRTGPNFSIETACFENARNLYRIRVWVLFIFENGVNEFYAQWGWKISKNKTQELSFQKTKNFKGSGTPMTIIPKKLIPPIDITLQTEIPNLPLFQ